MNNIEEVEVRVLFFGKARELMDCEETRARIPRVLPYVKLKELIFNKLFGVLDCISASCVLAVDLSSQRINHLFNEWITDTLKDALPKFRDRERVEVNFFNCIFRTGLHIIAEGSLLPV
ncbi:hypothetical protein Aduo_010604 [Ancylostoma duodenale]